MNPNDALDEIDQLLKDWEFSTSEYDNAVMKQQIEALIRDAVVEELEQLHDSLIEHYSNMGMGSARLRIQDRIKELKNE